MKKRYVLSSIGIGTAIGYLSINKNMRKNIMGKISGRKKQDAFESMLEDAGNPGQTVKQDEDQIEKAKMVAEGSQFGVQYYNEMREKYNIK